MRKSRAETSADRSVRDVLLTTLARPGGEPLEPRARAARTAAAVEATREDWARPWWLDRQLRPSHAAFVAPGDHALVDNVTGRTWTALATTSAGPLALVDPAGAVHAVGSSWSLDWAIGAEDRWHCPASESSVRQRLVSHAPVVETACKVPSGDAVVRAFAVATSDGDAVVVEIDNESPAPFVAVFSVRPAHPLGIGSVSSIRLEHPYVLIDERPVLVLDARVSRWCFRDAPDDALLATRAGDAHSGDPQEVRSETGLATASFLVPVPRNTSARAVLYPHAARRTRPNRPANLPSAGQVARGWEAHVARAARIELPDRRITDVYAASLRALVAATAGRFPVPIGRETDWSVADEAAIVCTLASVGLVDTAADVLRRRCDENELDSWFRREQATIARNVAVFEALGAYWASSHDATVIEATMGAVVKAAHWTERARSRGNSGRTPSDARRAARALEAITPALRAADQAEAADDIDAFAARFLLDIDEVANDAHHAAPFVESFGERSDGVADVEREPAVSSWRGADPVATARAGRVDLAARDGFAFERLAWLVRTAGNNMRWPTFVSPHLGSGCGGTGDDPLAAAAFVDLVRAIAVEEDPSSATLVVLPVVPPSWYGQSIDVHDLLTHLGRLSFAVRWHAARPAILWELTPNDPSTRVTILAPGLDASWSTHAFAGEELLSLPPLAASVPLVEQPASDHVPMTTLEPRLRRVGVEELPTDPAGSPIASFEEPGESFA